jgi:PAS domain S-box-containing protein
MKLIREIRKIKIIYVFTTIFLVGLSIFTFSQLNNLIHITNLVNHTNKVSITLEKIALSLSDAERTQTGYLLTGDSLLLNKKNQIIDDIYKNLKLLDSLESENKIQKDNISELRKIVGYKISNMDSVMQNYIIKPINANLKSNIIDGLQKMDQVELLIKDMAKHEDGFLKNNSLKYSKISLVTLVFIIVLFIGALLILLVSYVKIIKILEHSNILKDQFENEKILAQTILNSSPNSIIVIDDNLRYLSANPTAEKLLFTLTDSYVGKKVTDIFPNSESIPDMKRALNGETVKYNDFYSEITKQHYEIVYTPLKIKNKLSGLIANSRDVTEALTLSKKLEIQNKELEKMNEELQLFIRISSHDLKAPLQQIQLSSSRILDKDFEILPEKSKEHFRRVQNAAKSMQSLIKDLLSYSEIVTHESSYEDTNLNSILDEVISYFQVNIDENGAQITITEICDVFVIPFQFRQLFINIIGNSLKFAKPDFPVRIIIKSSEGKGSDFNKEYLRNRNEKLQDNLHYCHITIADNGIGFEPEYSEKIFEVFQRLHEKGQFEGTGIGLAIVKKIIDKHNGVIIATGELDKGATFDIFIPTSKN